MSNSNESFIAIAKKIECFVWGYLIKTSHFLLSEATFGISTSTIYMHMKN